ncbi:hypothetical protein TI39_contig405g00006 [Zymoseptoria brevis]|uniref:Uncharacterized protein n=1 Tax=Zymoseptoria brevis TaxID=1047168 RepID=A0A0F4GME7_9PEZI|nr:hypothetical protein TI39_contig405g00006 [Zymoseptoria brevis]
MPPTQAEMENATRPLFFSLVIPGGKKQDVETCRTVLSAQVLNYPIPQLLPLATSPSQPRDEGLVNENGVDQEVTETQPPSPAALWVDSILKWLGRTPPEGEDGIVLLLDEPGVYFQLRPQVLLQRYYRILMEADESARATRMEDVKNRVRHSIVFPAATCRLVSDGEVRARCDATADRKSTSLGEGYMIGPVKDIRQLLTRTSVALKQDPSASVHNIFTTLYTRQLLHRQTSVDQSWFTFNQDPELGITLDTTSLLSTSIDPSNNSSSWKSLSTLPPEISESTPPYWTVFGSEPSLPHTATWSDVLLFHPSSQISLAPAMLFHPPSTTPAVQRTQTWKSLFYHPHARTLYTAAQHLPSTIVASISIFSSDGRTRLGERRFWNRKAKPDTAGAFNGGLKKGLQIGDALEEDFWPWRDMCGGEAEVEGVFGDGIGPWVGGRFY